MTSIARNNKKSFRVADPAHGQRSLEYFPVMQRVVLEGVWLTPGQVRKLDAWLQDRLAEMEADRS